MKKKKYIFCEHNKSYRFKPIFGKEKLLQAMRALENIDYKIVFLDMQSKGFR